MLTACLIQMSRIIQQTRSGLWCAAVTAESCCGMCAATTWQRQARYAAHDSQAASTPVCWCTLYTPLRVHVMMWNQGVAGRCLWTAVVFDPCHGVVAAGNAVGCLTTLQVTAWTRKESNITAGLGTLGLETLPTTQVLHTHSMYGGERRHFKPRLQAGRHIKLAWAAWHCCPSSASTTCLCRVASTAL